MNENTSDHEKILKLITDFAEEQNKEQESIIFNKNNEKMNYIKKLNSMFSLDILESFNSFVIDASGLCFECKAETTINNIPITITLEPQLNFTSTIMRFRIGHQQVATADISIPEDKDIKDPERLEIIQNSNLKHFARCMYRIQTIEINAIKNEKIRFWTNDIPWNYSGSYRVPQLLLKLEEDKFLISEELYLGAKNTLLDVVKQQEQYDADKKERLENSIKIAKEEYIIWEKEHAAYEKSLCSCATLLIAKYFKPYKLHRATYMMSNFDASILKDEDGELVPDILEAITCGTTYIPGSEDAEGFVTTVDVYGNLGKRKIMGSILHIDCFEYNQYSDVNSFCKKIYVDNKNRQYPINLPPGTVLEPFDKLQEPISWEERCKQRGLEDPWNYKGYVLN